ncbi:MAG: hypothetical protein RSA29_15075 [Clostridium sp.]|uniref:hypothetical protein n=1 Tax=Clostridium sp. TaxID=1506 RepID=UPI00305D2AD5
MKEDKILIIDLKKRICEDSVILNIDDSEVVPINLDFNLIEKNNEILQCIKSMDINKGIIIIKECTEMVRQGFIKNTYPEEVKKYSKLSKFIDAMNLANDAIKQKKSMDNFLKCRDILKILTGIEIYNDISDIRDVYNHFHVEILKIIDSYDISFLIKELEDNLDSEKNMEKSINIAIKEKSIIETIDEGKNLLLHVGEIKTGLITEFNSGTNTSGVIRKLFGESYKEILNSSDSYKYLELLKPSYESYDEIKKDMEFINNIYLMNNANNFNDYYNALLSLDITKLINMTSYLREYISNKIFEEKVKYYSLEKIEDRINTIINEVNLSNYPTMIPI